MLMRGEKRYQKASAIEKSFGRRGKRR